MCFKPLQFVPSILVSVICLIVVLLNVEDSLSIDEKSNLRVFSMHLVQPTSRNQSDVDTVMFVF